MLCDKCKKNYATTHLKTVINGVVSEVNLCEECALSEGYGTYENLSLANMLASMLGEGLNTKMVADKRCDCCGSSFSDIAKTGRVGCSECYTTFKNQLSPSLNRLHGKAAHIGKRPKSLNNTPQDSKTEKIDKLRKELEKAILNEEFEQAARIRDEIKGLEG